MPKTPVAHVVPATVTKVGEYGIHSTGYRPVNTLTNPSTHTVVSHPEGGSELVKIADAFAPVIVPWYKLHGYAHDEDPQVGDAVEVVHFADGEIALARRGTFAVEA